MSTFLDYEQLEDPIQYPESFPSPYTVLQWQAGDCFDLSLVLVSLLAGAGYDAYVVAGYAPREITTCDQVRRPRSQDGIWAALSVDLDRGAVGRATWRRALMAD